MTKERFPLLRFILADVPFQNMSLNEQYSDEEQRSSKHENCRHINLIITIFANFRKVDLRRYFTLIIFREIAQRVHANPSNDNFRPHGKH